jgi:hypothetical protein
MALEAMGLEDRPNIAFKVGGQGHESESNQREPVSEEGHGSVRQGETAARQGGRQNLFI